MSLTVNQYDHVLTWLKYCRIMSADTHRRNAKRLDMDDILKAELLKEQARRVAEIKRLERAVQREIDALTAEGEGGEE